MPRILKVQNGFGKKKKGKKENEKDCIWYREETPPINHMDILFEVGELKRKDKNVN